MAADGIAWALLPNLWRETQQGTRSNLHSPSRRGSAAGVDVTPVELLDLTPVLLTATRASDQSRVIIAETRSAPFTFANGGSVQAALRNLAWRHGAAVEAAAVRRLAEARERLERAEREVEMLQTQTEKPT